MYKLLVKLWTNDAYTQLSFSTPQELAQEALYRLGTGWTVVIDAETIARYSEEITEELC